MTVKLAEVKRPVNDDAVSALEDALSEAKSGNLVEVVVVGNLADEKAFYANSQFRDRWRLLGALEYAKSAVFRAL